MSRTQYSQWHRPTAASGASGVGYGFSRTAAEVDPMALPDGDELPVEFMDLGTEIHRKQFDDFGLITSATEVTIDAEHAGRWQLGCKAEMHGSTTGPGYQLQMWLRVSGEFIETAFFARSISSPVDSSSDTISLVIDEVKRDLVEGDVITMTVDHVNGDGVDGFLSNSRLFGTYMGPALFDSGS